MEPIEVLELCVEGSLRGAPDDIVVPHIFSLGEYEQMYALNHDRCVQLFDELILGDHVADGLELLMKAGIIRALFPELQALKDLGNDGETDGKGLKHKDVWLHTKQVVANTAKIRPLRYGALFHDIGKARTLRFIEGKVTFHGHDAVGGRMLEKLQERMKLFDDKTYDLVDRLVYNHMRVHCNVDHWTDSSCRRIVADMGGSVGFTLLAALGRADATSKFVSKRAANVARVDAMVKRVIDVRIDDARPRLPKNTMGIIIQRGICSIGPALNAIRDGLEQMMFSGDLPTDKDAEWYAVEGTKALFALQEEIAREIHADMQDVLDRRGETD